MKQKYFLVFGIIVMMMGITFPNNGLFIYAQAPQPVEDSPIADTPPSEVEDPSTPPTEEQRCEPVKPDELEGVSGAELIQRWLNYAECKGIDINKVSEMKLRDCGPEDYKCEEFNKRIKDRQTIDFTIWFMSSHEIILSEGLDPALAEYIKNVPQDHPTPVIIQLNPDTSIAEMIELINLGLRYYRGSALANGSYLTFVPANSIPQIVNKPYIAGITLFKPSFKYDLIPTTEDKVETHVNTIEESKPYHESDLNRIGIDVFGYDKTSKFYVVKMSSSQYNDVANLEWTKLISAIPESIPEGQLVKATDKTDNYTKEFMVSKEGESSKSTIYVIIGFIFLVALVFLIFKIRRK